MKRVRGDCPLGSTCEYPETREIDGKQEMVLVTCPWFKELKGKDALGDEHNEWDCSISWMPLLHVEIAGTNRQVSASINKMHNENTERQNAAIEAIKSSTKPTMKVIESS